MQLLTISFCAELQNEFIFFEGNYFLKPFFSFSMMTIPEDFFDDPKMPQRQIRNNFFPYFFLLIIEHAGPP